MTEVRCLPVSKEYLPAIWPVVRPMLEKAVATAPDKIGVDDVVAGAYQGIYVIWVILVSDEIVASVTTRIVDYPRGRVMILDWVGGSRMKEWFTPAMHVIKDHARRNGCSCLEAYGREAWDRWVRKEGWRQDYVAFKMDLTDDASSASV